jgi:FkbH-like protein
VARILKAWNIGADSVVFVDDSPMELEEVRAAHPGIECLLFPKADYAQGLAFFDRLRDLFGKAHLSEEDSLRLPSIRQMQQFEHPNSTGAAAETFLERAEAVLTMEYDPPASDTRVVELVNKTNQFNLNGIRYTEAEWQDALRHPRSFCATVSYRDKFGLLGKIAVIRGRAEQNRLAIGTWVMSCRAFSRRIEYQSLYQIFRKFSAAEIVFEYRATAKNAPIQAFLTQVLEQPPTPDIKLTFEQFEARRPRLYHQVIENK